MPDFNSPNTGNYAVFKGNAYFTPAGGARRHIGNCTQFDVTPSVDSLDHFSAMAGVKTKDKSVVLTKTLTIDLTLEEFTAENMALALFGDGVGEDTDGNKRIDIFASSEVSGRLELTGSNDIGPRWDYDLPNVTFKPNGAISAIGDSDWANVQVTGEVLFTAGHFGFATLQESTVSEEGSE